MRKEADMSVPEPGGRGEKAGGRDKHQDFVFSVPPLVLSAASRNKAWPNPEKPPPAIPG